MPNKNMQAVFDFLRKTSGPVLTFTLFAAVFVLGFAVFTFSGSIGVASFCMAMTSVASALAARELIGRPSESQIRAVTQDEMRAYNRRLTDVADRVMEIEAEIRHVVTDRVTPERMRFDALALDIERIGTILRDLVLIVDAQDTRYAQGKLKLKPQAAAPPQPIHTPAKPIQKSGNPLAALQMENILREDILSGKLKVHLTDISHVETGRTLLRQVVCALHGRQAEFRSDHDLVKANISPGIIQLFDRMRFGFAFEFASQFGIQAGSTPILCPLKKATFSNPNTADEIVDIIEKQSEIASSLILALDHNLLTRPTPQEEERLRRLQIAGSVLAAVLTQDMIVDPDILVERGVRFAIADTDMLLGRNGQFLQSAIHPADLASYLARHDITLIAQQVDAASDAKSLKSMGVLYASGSAIGQNGTTASISRGPSVVKTRGESEIAAAITNADLGLGTTSITSIAPLRERLRRVRT